jgi:hypothetical protein
MKEEEHLLHITREIANILHLPPRTKEKRPPVSSSIAHLPKLQVIILGRIYNAYFP